VSTASRYCRIHQLRLQAWGYAPLASGSLSVAPQALRPARLQWLNMSAKDMRKCDMNLAKIAAFPDLALSLSAIYPTSISICGLEALAGASPPFSFSHNFHGPPRNIFEGPVQRAVW
jgi:hypothetical protein